MIALFRRYCVLSLLGTATMASLPAGGTHPSLQIAGPSRAMAQSLFEEEVAVPPCDMKPEWILTEDIGPVMVKVVSFSGKSSKDLAAALVKELREEHHIDAYAFRYQISTPEGPSKEYLEEYKRQYREKYQVNPPIRVLRKDPPENWVVLAGSFDSFESFRAQSMLKKVRKLKSTSIPEEVARKLVFGRRDGTFANPLHKAMLVRNPKAPREQRPPIDKATARMLISLNDDEPFSIYRQSSPYTIQVCEFRGMQVFDEKEADKILNLFRKGEKKSGLELAAQNADLITEKLRQMGYDAYVFHGKFSSIVTIGGYSSPQDRRTLGDVEKLRTVELGQFKLDPKPILTPRRPTDYAN